MKLWITSRLTKIFRIELGSSNCYLLEKNGHYLLVDTGIVSERKKIVRILERQKIHQLDAIFLTHVHTDSAGNAAYLSRLFHCRVYGPKTELESLMTGQCEVAEGVKLFSRLLNYIMYRMDIYTRIEGVNNAAAYPEGDASVSAIGKKEDWDLLVLKTPGHTEGSVSIIVDEEVALVGDSMDHALMGSIYPTFAKQEGEILLSWKKLLLHKCKLYLPSHGRVIKHRLLMESYSVYRQNNQKKMK